MRILTIGFEDEFVKPARDRTSKIFYLYRW